MTKISKIKEFVFDNGTYYLGKCEDGSVRVGMNSYCHFQVHKEHELYQEISSLRIDNVEDFIDNLISKGFISI